MQQLIIVSGSSGSGKTVAMHALEDLGFYCVDNLPINLLSSLAATISAVHYKAAVSIDSRNLQFEARDLDQILEELNQTYSKVQIFFLDASPLVLIRRFSHTRRKHPLSGRDLSLEEAIAKEKSLLNCIKELSTIFIDTSNTSQHQLYQLIEHHTNIHGHATAPLNLLIESFGFKNGLPPAADFVFDLRCLPNPYWQLDLRGFTGLDTPVQTFLNACDLTGVLIGKINHLLVEFLSCFQAERRSYITVALGCTGGRHRSVYVAERVAESLAGDPVLGSCNIQIRHRDINT